jgi:Ca2+-binding EF-hand superfamily protein
VVEKRGYSSELIFKGFDSDSDGMLTIFEFNTGINSLITLSPRILERIFSLMDVNKIGMVDFENFQRIMEIKAPF